VNLSRLASALGIGVPAALIATFPAAVRCSASATSSVGLISAWPALAGIAVLPMAAAIVVLRGAREGIADLADDADAIEPLTTAGLSDLLEPSDAGRPALGAAMAQLRDLPDEHVPSRAALLGAAFVGWGALLVAGLAPLGALLRARTHHHGLAGVTFAVVSLLFALGLALVVRRAVELAASAKPLTQRIALGAFWIALGLVVLMLAVLGGLRSAAAPDAAATAAVVAVVPALTANALTIDLVAFALAAAFASRPLGSPRVESALAWGAIAAALLVVLGAGSLGRVDGLQEELTRSSPLFALASPSAPPPPAPASSAD
jgi:hypothetical protein